MRSIISMLTLAVLLLPLAANAGTEHSIMQKGKKFRPVEISIKVGDTVTFVNDDRTRHIVYSKTVGHEFKIRKQKPGAKDSVVFDSSGTVNVRCTIHPKMKLVINISE